MNKTFISLLFIALILFSGCFLFPGVPAIPSIPAIYMVTLDSTFCVGETISVDINIDDMEKDIFGMSLRIVYDPDYISFDDAQNNWIGDVWPIDAISILEHNGNTIYISITEIAGASNFKPNGTVFSLDFTIEQADTTLIDFVNDQIFFYDEDGAVINLSEIELLGYTLIVQ